MMIPGSDCYIAAPADGVFEPCPLACATVRIGGVAGWLHSIEDVDRAPMELRFRHRGTVWFSPGPGRVRRGDSLIVVMPDYDKTTGAFP